MKYGDVISIKGKKHRIVKKKKKKKKKKIKNYSFSGFVSGMKGF